MRELTVLTPTGCIGNRGLHEEALIKALDDMKPGVIAVDGGSLDPGPWYLGAGHAHSPMVNIRRDLEIILREGVGKRKIPFVVGSSGGSGAKPHVDLTLKVVKGIAQELNLDFKVGYIYADVDQEDLARRLRNGTPARKVPTHIMGDQLTEEEARRAARIVAMMGAEPIMKAFKEGADVVLAGRAVDAAVVAAYPIMQGFDRALALHMGDIMECGELALVDKQQVTKLLAPNRVPVVGTIREDHFIIRAGHPGMICTVESASAHSLYERDTHTQLELPGGILDKGASRFTQADERTVMVSGTQFYPKPFTVLLEGVQHIGYRTIGILGARNPRTIAQIDDILAHEQRTVQARFGGLGKFEVYYHVYGKGAVLGAWEPQHNPTPQELGIVVDVVAESQRLARDIAEDLCLKIAFSRYAGRTTTAGNVGYLFSPNVIDVGEVYTTTIYHQMPVNDPLELFDVRVQHITEVEVQ